ncbi:iron chelate uptake ABC transporter family permease subunit [Haloimpatiens sp. FM7330]|uniref:iron chelate uptake ABC transporter family permease subunit n=1 Tax=Haloimpatiens sp. FM7330 TaxID=3298610 RepID=UPI00362EC003
MKNRRLSKNIIIFSVLCIVLIISFLLNVGLGSIKISISEIFKVILKKEGSNQMFSSIIWKIRLPRALASMIGGSALALSGLLLQIFFRNPIVGPFVLGISSGATLFVGLTILAGISFGFSMSSPLFSFFSAFFGSLLVMLLVLLVARKVKNTSTLLIIGLMIGYVCSAITHFLVTFANKEQLQGFYLWTLGSFSGFTWQKLKILFFIVMPFLIISFLICKPLNALLLGQNYARSMGVDVKKTRIIIVFLSSILAAVPTAFSGPISFIGLAVPHIARLSFGTSDNRILIPAAILLGGVVTSLCDMIARMMFSPVELAISTVTSIIGAPIVIWLLLKRRKNV